MPASPVEIWDFGGSRFLQQQCAQVEEQQAGGYSLGCIFENPIAFEDSRRKIDYFNDRSDEVTPIRTRRRKMAREEEKLLNKTCQDVDDLDSPRKTGPNSHRKTGPRKASPSPRKTGPRTASPSPATSYSPRKTSPSPRKTCPRSPKVQVRRRLYLDDIATQQRTCPEEYPGPTKKNSMLGGTQSSTVANDNELSSSRSSSCPEDLLELKLDRGAGACTPVAHDVVRTSHMCSPVPSAGRSASLRSLDGLAIQAAKDRIDDLESDSGSDTSAGSDSRPSKGDEFCVYPGWSLWNSTSNRQHSYRSINESPVHNSCAPSLRRLGVKSLHQHLISAARQQQQPQHSLKSCASGKAVVKSRSPRMVASLNRACSRSKVLQQQNIMESAKPEEGKIPLLKSQRTLKKHARKTSWEPVTFFTRGLRSLTSKGVSPSTYSFPAVIPVPGCNIPKLVQQRQLLKPEHVKTLPLNHRTGCSSEGGSTGPLLQDGYLQCIFKHGVTSYSFWTDNFDEVIVAKVGESGHTGDRCFTFYTCTRKNRERWKQLQKPMVNRVATMNLSSSIRTEADCRGDIIHFMDSEFSLMDRKPVTSTTSKQSPRKAVTASVSSYFKSLWRHGHEQNGPEVSGLGYEKEMAAMVVRVPLKVKKEWRSLETETTGRKKPLGRLLRKQVEPKTISQASWNSIVGSASETISVILPVGDHGHPICGLEGPRPLIERWKSGGLCDCGSWDLGCGIVVLSKQYAISKQGDNQPLSFLIEGRMDKGIAMSLEQCQDGLFKLSYQQPLISLQAFATAVAILHSKSGMTDYRDYSQEWQTKLPVVKGNLRRSRGRCHPNPPLSPIHRL